MTNRTPARILLKGTSTDDGPVEEEDDTAPAVAVDDAVEVFLLVLEPRYLDFADEGSLEEEEEEVGEKYLEVAEAVFEEEVVVLELVVKLGGRCFLVLVEAERVCCLSLLSSILLVLLVPFCGCCCCGCSSSEEECSS